MFQNRILLDETAHEILQGKKHRLSFRVTLAEEGVQNCRFKLRMRGKIGIHPSLMYEGGLPYLYRDLDDALCRDTHHSRFSLRIHAEQEEYPRRAWYKILCPPAINSQYPVPEGGDALWRFQGTVKTEGFQVEEGGKGEIQFACYYKKEGKDPRDISGEPDETVVIPLPKGDCDWQRFGGTVPLGENMAVVLAVIWVERAAGTVYLEDLQLKNDKGFNILPAFDLTNLYHPLQNWMGENLSEKEWSNMQITLNQSVLPNQKLFQRCYAGAENEILLPDGLVQEGENELELCNVSDYFCAAPYCLYRLELLWEQKRNLEIISVPEHVAKGENFGILFKTQKPATRVCLEAESGLEGQRERYFAEAGLHVWELRATKVGSRLDIVLSAGEERAEAQVERVVERVADGILTGSGDAVYIPQDQEEMEEFLCWYLAGHLGNYITFRPVYRWSGNRICNGEMWEYLSGLCSRLHLPYCYIIDGRELPGINANPTDKMLESAYYLGSQGHERDGAFYYWLQMNHQKNDTLFEEVARRICKHPDHCYRTPLLYEGKEVYFNFSPVKARNMEEGAAQFVDRVSMSLKGVRRHTGPSTLFRYFYQAGVQVCGAELMYGPQEVVLAALRGASIAYGRELFTAHLAVQWSTTPHDSAAHARRFRLALLISYLQGCSQINTEEGFYRMEEYFAEHDRFSSACVRHADVQREFLRFVETHSRRGRMKNPIALLHGRNDGWVCFTRRNVWSQEGEQWEFGAPEASWDLMQVFYPDAVMDAIYRHPCPDSPQGYYSRTPYGTVDILPVEASEEIYGHYGHMAFMGFHTAMEEDLEKLTEYVKQGGRLLLGLCHLTVDSDRETILYGTPRLLDASALTGVHFLRFQQKNQGITPGQVTLAEDVEVLEERNGSPLLVRRRLGQGMVYLVNAREYPGETSVCNLYSSVLRRFGEEAIAENSFKGWLRGFNTVESAVYDREDGHRVIYAVNTNWWSKEAQETWTTLLLSGNEYRMKIPRDVMTTVTVQNEIAVSVSDMETEILEIRPYLEGFFLRLQGLGSVKIRVFCPYDLKEGENIFREEDAYRIELQLNGVSEFRYLWESGQREDK